MKQLKHAGIIEALLAYSQRKHLTYTQEQHYKWIADTLANYLTSNYAYTERELLTSIEQQLNKD